MGFVIKGNQFPVPSWIDSSSHGLLLRFVFCAHKGSKGTYFNLFSVDSQVGSNFFNLFLVTLHLFPDPESGRRDDLGNVRTNSTIIPSIYVSSVQFNLILVPTK